MHKYSVERVVGEGSFGKALLCKRKSDNRKCIIKQISLGKMSHQEAKATEQESALLARLQHPNIVSFWESFNEVAQGRSNLFIVMDFADGGDLSDLIKSRKNKLMSETQVINIGVQISLAMKHVHDRKILHRDLKSGNIFLTKSGVVKLGDFGIARVLRNTGELASTQIGTPYFMSPEILQNQRYNSKTDIWSLGCVFFELAALKVPFDGSSMKQLINNIVRQATPRLSSQYSKELCQLVYAMLAKSPKERPSINTVLSQAVMRNQIASILDDSVRQKEFSHTILHGDNILKKPPLAVQPLASIREEGVVVPKPPPPSRPAPHPGGGAVHQVNQALQEARAKAQAQQNALAAVERERQLKKQQEAAVAEVLLRDQEAKRRMEEVKLLQAKQLRRKQLDEQAAREAAVQQLRREKENAEKMAELRKQEQARRVEKAAFLARQQEAEKERLAQYRRAAEAKEKERALAARAKLIEDRKQYEVNKRAAEKAAADQIAAAGLRALELAPPAPQHSPLIRPQQQQQQQQQHQANNNVAIARGGMGFNINGGEKRLNPRMKPSIPRQNPPPKNDLRIDGHGQAQRSPRPEYPQKPGVGPVVSGAGGGSRVVVVKEGSAAPGAAQLRRERFDRLRDKAKLSQELADKKNAQNQNQGDKCDPVADTKNYKKELRHEAQQVGALRHGGDSSDSEDSDSDSEGVVPVAQIMIPSAIAIDNNKQWFSNLEKQMGNLKGEINNLREAKSPRGTPPAVQKVPVVQRPPVAAPTLSQSPPHSVAKNETKNSQKVKKAAKTDAVTPPTAQELALRKIKREEESKNLREFVRAQRNAIGTPSPSSNSTPSSKSPKVSRNKKAPENLSMHFSHDEADSSSKKSPRKSSKVSSPPPSKESQQSNESAAEALRKKRDAERRELKKMIAEKRSEKIYNLQSNDIEVAVTSDEIHIVDEYDSAVSTEKKSPSKNSPKIKFKDFLGRDYTPVTSEEDAALIGLSPSSRLDIVDQKQQPPSDKYLSVASHSALFSVDDSELNKRSTKSYDNKEFDIGKLLVSSSCGDLLLPAQGRSENSTSSKNEDKVTMGRKTSTYKEEKQESVVESVVNVLSGVDREQQKEELDPHVYVQLAEELGEVWGDGSPDDVVGELRSGRDEKVERSVEVEEYFPEQDDDVDAEHARVEFSNMLSVMQSALNIPDRAAVNENGESDDDSTFEEDEEEIESNRIVGTFSPEEITEMLHRGENMTLEETSEDSDSLGSSWGDVEDEEEFDDSSPPQYVSEHDLTVFGVPFPINTGQRDAEGMNLDGNDTPACRMEYIREFLEDSLGEEKFVQAYRLLKAIDIVDEDSLLEQMEAIVGTDGLRHMDVFIQLITIEERFENM